MKIKDVAAHTQLSQKAIRFYEEKELISPSMKEVSGRYFREYSEHDVERLKEIALLRKAGFSISQIQDMYQGNVTQTLSEYRLFLSQQIKEQTKVLEQIASLKTDSLADLIAVLEQSQVPQMPPIVACTELEASSTVPPKKIWYWHGMIPHRLKGIPFALTLLLWQTPMSELAIINYCQRTDLKLTRQKLHRMLQRLMRAGIIKCEKDVYSCTSQDFMLWEYTFTDDDILHILTFMQSGVGQKFFYQSGTPMSVNSGTLGPK